jgi:phosphoesterase RecJ-like protein
MTNLIDSQLVEKANHLLGDAQQVVIFTHMAPDGDAMGSSLAMYHYLRNLKSPITNGKCVTVVTPNAFPDFLAWIPGADQIKVYEQQPEVCNQLLEKADLAVCLDFNDPKRIGPIGDKLLQVACPKVLIDHHLDPSDFATVTISHPESSSTCELVYRLFYQISGGQCQLTNEIATALYTGLMTDTGNFAYNSNNPDLYEIVADLMRAGIVKDAIYDHVFNQYSADRMRLVGYCLYRKMRVFPEHHLALITLSIDELKQFNYKQGDTEGIVNMPLQMGDIFYSVFMREQEPKPGTTRNVVKVSFRSQGNRPVNIMAAEVFRGGGHMNAAGGEFYGPIQSAVRLFLSQYAKYLK